jgi:hypothetical protein
MPQIIRIKARFEVKENKLEKKLKAYRETLAEWKARKLGLKAPADSESRMELGEKIANIKDQLVQSGLYGKVSQMDRDMKGEWHLR